jgi:hypothetical protein
MMTCTELDRRQSWLNQSDIPAFFGEIEENHENYY